MPLTKEEAIRFGYKIHPVQHTMKRRAEWNDYYLPGRYGITVHIATDTDGNIDRTQLLCGIAGSCRQRDVRCVLTEVGMFVARRIAQIGMHPDYGAVRCIHSVIMPTHIHLTIEITRQLPVVMRGGRPLQLTLGHMLGAFKGGCTSLYRHFINGDFLDCTAGSEAWCRRCDYTYVQWQQWKAENRHIRGGNSDANGTGHGGGNSDASGIANCNKCSLHVSEGHPPSLWEPNYTDKILDTTRKVSEWIYYEDMNPYFWQLQNERPHLLEHRLHISVVMRDNGKAMDFSAYGCMFLLRKGDRIPVQCTRLATKSMLTLDEWTEFSRPERARMFETDRMAKPLGHYDRDWLYSTDPACKTPIPYPMTQHFARVKASFLAMARRHVILVSPAVSDGEKDIIYTAVSEGCPVIKLVKKPFDRRNHPANKDRELCAQGMMLVMGPWEIPHGDHFLRNGNIIPVDSDYAVFHDLNKLAARMCGEISNMNLRGQFDDRGG